MPAKLVELIHLQRPSRSSARTRRCTLVDTVANECGTSVHEASAKYRDILFAFPDLTLESPKALHVNPSLCLEDGILVRELLIKIRLVSFALLSSTVAISRDATRSRAAKEGERHRERQTYGCAAAHGEPKAPRDHMQVASAARPFAELSALGCDACPGRFATMVPVTSALAATRPIPIAVSFAAFHP